MHVALFEVKVKMPRPMLVKEAEVVEQIIRQVLTEKAVEGGLSPEECAVEVVGPHSHVTILPKGTRIRVHRDGIAFNGIVDTAQNYGSPEDGDNWYIEFHDTLGIYHYWKQALDGGRLEVVDEDN